MGGDAEGNGSGDEQIARELAIAIAEQRLNLYFQPIVSLQDRSATMLEALPRWPHPELGILAPGDFIGIAAESGLLGELERWAIEAAFVQLAAWRTRRRLRADDLAQPLRGARLRDRPGRGGARVGRGQRRLRPPDRLRDHRAGAGRGRRAQPRQAPRPLRPRCLADDRRLHRRRLRRAGSRASHHRPEDQPVGGRGHPRRRGAGSSWPRRRSSSAASWAWRRSPAESSRPGSSPASATSAAATRRASCSRCRCRPRCSRTGWSAARPPLGGFLGQLVPGGDVLGRRLGHQGRPARASRSSPG